jgi:hypothetical protein
VRGERSEQAWRKRLGRLRLGVEPIAEQLARSRRATWTLTFVSLGIGSMILAIFTAFSAPRTGLVVVGVILGPIIAGAWFGDWRLRRAARACGHGRHASGAADQP